MDAEQFDRWTQGLETRVARRGLSGLLLAAAVAMGADTAGEAKKRKIKSGRSRPPVPRSARTDAALESSMSASCLRSRAARAVAQEASNAVSAMTMPANLWAGHAMSTRSAAMMRQISQSATIGIAVSRPVQRAPARQAVAQT